MFDITKADIEQVISNNLIKTYPLVIKQIPAKEKKRYILTCMMIHYFEAKKLYDEKEVNSILQPMVNDYVMFRRNLIDYGFLKRKSDGSAYWLDVDKSLYQLYDLTKQEAL